jgi:RNA polymerase sigma-70 factor (ECF subfamily)
LPGERNKSVSFMRHLGPLQRALEAYCRRSLLQSSDVSDVLQASIANAYRDFHLYVEGSNFRAWVFRYLNGEILNANRRQARQPQSLEWVSDIPDDETRPSSMEGPFADALRNDPDEVLEQCDQALAEAVRNLPAQERSVFLLRSIGEFKYREIAEILGVPLGTVMTWLSRSRLRLRAQLEEFGRSRGLLRADETRPEG